MDWAKAKSILIFIMLALNLFLLAHIAGYWSGEGVSRDTIADAERVLAQRGISLECKIPSYGDNMPRLVYQNGTLDRAKIVQRLMGNAEFSPGSQQSEIHAAGKKLVFKDDTTFVFTDENPSGQNLDVSSKENITRFLRKFMNDLGFKASRYKLESFTRDADGSTAVYFTEKHGKFLVFDNYASFVINDKGIIYAEFKSRKIKGFARGDKIKILPAYKILLKNLDAGQGKDVSITAIDIGFKGYAPEQDMVEYFEVPALRVMYSDGGVRYFKASDGMEIK